MIISKRLAVTVAAIIAIGGLSNPAAAQATRTWVSGVGDDVNPCSRTAPCKTFAGAISKTAPGGEINCLDPGGFGAVTITKAITISCLHTEGGALAGGNGIVVNAQPGDVVFLRGLDIFGVNPPANGVHFIAGGALHIDQTIIRRFNSANSYGISFAPTGNSKLYISGSMIADNGNGITGGGIGVEPGPSGTATVFIIDSIISNNAGNGIGGAGAATIYVTGTRILGNATGVAAAEGASINSSGDNLLTGNGADGSFQLLSAKK
jgi:hypothetical protein